MLTFPLSVFFFFFFLFLFEAWGLSARQGKFLCLSQAVQAASQSVHHAHRHRLTHTHTRRTLSRTNREVSLEEAAALAAVTALLKSETLVPVNSNLALRRPLSHSVPPPPQTSSPSASPSIQRHACRRVTVHRLANVGEDEQGRGNDVTVLYPET